MTDFTTLGTKHNRTSLALLAESFRVQSLFFVIPLLFLAFNAVLFRELEEHGAASLKAVAIDLVAYSIPAGLVAVFLLRLVQYAFYEKPAHPALQMATDIAEVFRRPARIIMALPVLTAIIFLNKAMFELKPTIPLLNPFSWDKTFVEWDRYFHYGYDPWVLLQPVLGYDIVTYVLNYAYNFWFVALFGVLVWFLFQARSDELRTRFLLSFMLVWFAGGGIMALYFSSAGPVYYGALGYDPDPFAALRAYHQDVNTRYELLFINAQELLWRGYTGQTGAIGISAFPSMHNATTTLFALALTERSRLAGLLMNLYAIVIFLASIHLGWHYAVDAYAGMMISIIAWYATVPIARWHARQPSTQQLNEHLAAL